MSTEIKPGQVWAYTAAQHETFTVREVRDGDVWSTNRYGGHIVVGAQLFQQGRTLLTDATPAPLDPSKVKAGDTVTLHVEYDDASNGKPYDIAGEVTLDSYGSRWIGPVMLEGEQGYEFTLTDHRPAPEPEPEWEDGQIGDALVHGASVRGFISNDGESFVFSAPGGGYHEAGYGSFEDFVPLVVIDPATARKALEDNGWGEHQTNEILHELGIEATR